MRNGAPLLVFFLAACASDPPEPARAQAPARTLAEEVALQEARHRPGESHRHLDDFVGEWSVTVQDMRTKDETPLTVARGQAQVTWIHGKRFLEWKMSLRVDGAPHEVSGLLGYDNVAREYEALWVNDLSTSMIHARGDGNPRGRGLVLYNVLPAAAGRSGLGPRSVMRFLDANSFVIERMAPDAAGDEVVVQRTIYARR